MATLENANLNLKMIGNCCSEVIVTIVLKLDLLVFGGFAAVFISMSESVQPAQSSTTVGTLIAHESITSGTQGQTTKFADDVSGLEADLHKPTELISSIRALNYVTGADSLTQFLSKPFKVTSGVFSTSDSTSIASFDPWQTAMGNVQYNYKMLGAFLIRADMEIRIIFNASKFQQGRYMLLYTPSGGALTTNASFQALDRAHNANLMTMTTQPHVEFDLADQTHAELKIPFMSIYPMHTIHVSGVSDMSLGMVRLYPYSALQAGSGSTTCGYSIYMNLTNIELAMPTINQSGYEVAYPQSGGSATSMEQFSKGKGPISSVAAKVAIVSDELGSFPILGEFSRNVGWIARFMAKSANAFGFSKPINLEPSTRMTRSVLPMMGSADTISQGMPLSLMSDNETVIHTGIQRTTEDEMDLSFIAQKYSYFVTYTWSSAAAADTLIANIPMTLTLFSANYGKGQTYIPYLFASQFFRFYRGGYKIRIKFVKTPFHSGRLMIGFIPQFRTYNSSTITTNGQNIYREAVDIRETSECEFCIPFVSPELYIEPIVSLGSFVITILDPLVAPNTVSQSIPMIIEVAADTDVEFAYPTSPEVLAYSPAVTQSGYSATPCFELGPRNTHRGLDPAKIAIGEQILSVRQLLKKIQFSINNPGTTAYNDELRYYLFLNNIATQITNNTTPILKDIANPGDPISVWSALYLFSTGGMRAQVFPSDSNVAAQANFVYMDQIPADTPTTACFYTPTWSIYGSCRGVFSSTVEPFFEVQAPSYTRTIARLNSQQLVSSADTRFVPSSLLGSNVTYVGVHATFGSYANPRTFVVMRSLADDSNFTGFYGTVPLVSRLTT